MLNLTPINREENLRFQVKLTSFGADIPVFLGLLTKVSGGFGERVNQVSLNKNLF